MKACLLIECIGDNVYRATQEMHHFINQVCRLSGIDGNLVGDVRIPANQFVAEISGFDKKFKYSRKFLRCKKDYARANSKGSRGVYAHYILESGKIYDVKAPVSWKKTDRYFCKVDEKGDICRLSEDEVIECLKSRSE